MKGQVLGLLMVLLCLFNNLGWAEEGNITSTDNGTQLVYAYKSY